MYYNKNFILKFIKDIKHIINDLKDKNEFPLYEIIRVIYSLFMLLSIQ